jgi:hypothetical protein
MTDSPSARLSLAQDGIYNSLRGVATVVGGRLVGPVLGVLSNRSYTLLCNSLGVARPPTHPRGCSAAPPSPAEPEPPNCIPWPRFVSLKSVWSYGSQWTGGGAGDTFNEGRRPRTAAVHVSGLARNPRTS